MKTPKATVRLSAWELVAIEEALANLVYYNEKELKALKDKIANAKLK